MVSKRKWWSAGSNVDAPPAFYNANLWCAIFGHITGKIWPIGSSSGKFCDELGNPIAYYAYICGRCGKRTAIDSENAVEKEKKRQEIAAVMNSSRARYGLKPLSWDD